MSFFKTKTINWKYIVGEILLLFVGINLAIWFNDWNTSKVIEKDKEIALNKIEGEIKANLEELVENSAQNQKIPAFYKAINLLRKEDSGLVVPSNEIRALVEEFPEFVQKLDSTPADNGLYQYEMDTFINLEITDLSSIAWDISKSTGIFHEFGYDCLYELQALYNTQELVKSEIRNATNALRDQSIDDLIRILGVLRQLEEQLEAQYKNMLENISNCK
ncbi:hypothetical protein GTQ34_09780 [Muricauda sp. JGD-17]|uniref:Uncharacterized protein n=1 Tax=Flagellimonas ochracea TaxID=2696472 RepID=A0A964TDX4_9FLAO|nr:hypothetical protein [Allomuricauda ochracea]NAY92208.1 hypothetical protein [Allomuricauda ochracea]